MLLYLGRTIFALILVCSIMSVALFYTGATPLPDMSSVMVARQMFVMYARTNQIQAIDSVYTNIKDTNTLRQQCEQGE